MQTPELTTDSSVLELIPHRPPMRFLKEVLAGESDRIECLVIAGTGAETRNSDGTIRIANAIEYMAQACAAFSGLHSQAQTPEAMPQAGVIASIRNLELFAANIPEAANLKVSAHCAAHSSTLSQFDCEVHGANGPLAKGLFTVLTLKENIYE